MSATVSAESIRARLIQLARERSHQAELVLTRFAVERLLYRLGISAFRERFVLKGALLFDLWFDQANRPTRDADLLGYGDDDPAVIANMFAEIAAIEADDGVAFDAATVQTTDIRQQARYSGLRVTLTAHLAGARLKVQVDIGFGDVIATPVQQALYPSLLADLPAPNLQVYPKESLLAEKLHILASLGIANSRLKDYYDLWTLSEECQFDFAETASAVAATFARRETPLANRLPVGLSDEFGQDPAKKSQWNGFLSKTRLSAPTLPEVVSRLSAFLGPLVMAANDRTSRVHWPRGGPWLPAPAPIRDSGE